MAYARTATVVCILLLVGCGGTGTDVNAARQAETSGDTDGARLLDPMRDPSGFALTVAAGGTVDTGNPFFQSLGTNGRTCFTCHQATDGWTVTPFSLVRRFIASGGNDPIFRALDGATAPTADVSTLAARVSAYSMLLRRGVIRVGLPYKATSDFTLEAVDDPYHFASAAQLSLFRRPLPTTNLKFIATVNWDGRNMLPGLTVAQALARQSNGATVNHAQAAAPIGDDVRVQIVSFETGLFTAQAHDRAAGPLDEAGARGGPVALSMQPFSVGINDSFAAGFDPKSFLVYEAWEDRPGHGRAERARRLIAEGEEIFYSRPITLTGVAGLNDTLGAPALTGTCTTCHDAPDTGGHSMNRFFNTGVSDGARRTPDMPLYTFRCNATGQVIRTTDPGRGLISGLCAEIGSFKTPGLRGLPARAPYFHDGSAATVEAVVEFYDHRFDMKMSRHDQEALAAFLRTL